MFQRPVEARGPTVKKAERGLVFSGFTFELPGDVILDVLQGKLGTVPYLGHWYLHSTAQFYIYGTVPIL